MFIVPVTETVLKNCKSQEFANKSNFLLDGATLLLAMQMEPNALICANI
jgi:hypothetical protein